MLPNDQTMQSMPLPRVRRLSIATQLRYGLLLFAIFSLVPTAGLLIFLSFGALRDQLTLVQSERSRATASEIDSYIDDLQRKLSYLTRVRGLADLAPTTQHNLLEALIRHNAAYETVMLIQSDGTISAAVDPDGPVVPPNPSEQAIVRQAITRQEDVIGAVEFDPATKLPWVDMALPVRNNADAVAGAILARINLKFLWVIVGETAVGSTGYAYVVDHRNLVIAERGSTPARFVPREIMPHPFPVLARRMLPSVTESYTGLRGAEVLGSATTIRSMSWQVIVELPTSEAYAPLRDLMWVMIGGLLVAASAALAGSMLWGRALIQPLQHLTQAASRLSTGDLSAEVRLQRPDELGVLAHAFNEMSARLRTLFAELRHEEEFVSTILDTAGALVVVLDPRGHAVRFNRTAERLTGYTVGELASQPIWQSLALPGVRPAMAEQFSRLLTHREPVESEAVWRNREGEQRMIAWSHAVVRDQADAPAFVVGIGIDITERKQAETELHELTLQLRRSNQDLEQFAYVASHDLQEPLRMITSYVQLLDRRYRPQLDAKAQHYMHYVVDGATRMQTLINDLLAYSRVDRQPAHFALISVAETVRRALHNLQPAITEVAAEIQIDPLPQVRADPTLLTQLFQNLVANALKFRGSHACRIAITATRYPTAWAFSVADNGIGMEPQYAERIFVIFQRLHTRSEYAGTGIGLAICKKIVEQHHGSIWVDSTPGAGATFTFTLPLDEES